ncbi:MAG TPA: carboxypeptidase-like regulatory domain-containing protein [Armatimonadota bacterium]|nr:carboxypeptidase-like regulatory domain-containing protein [Armatimonadota bacterium]
MMNRHVNDKLRQACVALCFLTLVPLTLSPALAGPLYVSGRVESGAAPVAGAVVTLAKVGSTEPVDSAQSLQNGGFVLKAPAPDHYTLSVDHRDYAVVHRALDLTAGGVADLKLDLVPRPVIRLKLLGPDGQQMAEGKAQASVRVTWDGGASEGTSQGETDAGGLFPVTLSESLPAAGISRVLINARIPDVGCAQIYLEQWPNAPVEVKLEPGATLSGTAVDAAGQPIANAPIFMVRMFNDARFVATEQTAIASTNQAGKFTIPSVLYGTYVVMLRTADVAAGPQFVVLSAPESTITLKAHPAPPDPQKP